MPLPFLSVTEWREEFGSHSEHAFELLVPTLFVVKNGQVYLNLSIDIFDEMFDLLSVDPDMVAQTIDLSNIFADPEIEPAIITALMSLAEERLGYVPIDAAGSFVITFDDFRKYYGERVFDQEMSEKYENYSTLKNLLVGVPMV